MNTKDKTYVNGLLKSRGKYSEVSNFIEDTVLTLQNHYGKDAYFEHCQRTVDIDTAREENDRRQLDEIFK